MKHALQLASFGLVALALNGCAISVQREIELGNEYAAELDRELPIVRSRAVQRTIDDFMRPILARSIRPEINWNVRVVNMAAINAFAVPGGHLYVTTGLIQAANHYDELAGVMGHEMGHVDLRHSAEQIGKATAAQVGVGIGYVLLGREPGETEQVAVGAAAGALFAKFSRDDEREADRAAVSYMTEAGIDPSGLAGMFEILGALNERDPSALEQFFASHPTTDSRIEEVWAAIDATPGARAAVGDGISDEPIFATLQELVAALPPPPPPAPTPPRSK
ncbi:MAG: M48 family metallopeptidase [Gemmatimonadales bacterium]